MATLQTRPPRLGLLLLAGLLAMWAPMTSAFDRGRALYENHCQSCHEDWLHDRSERRVTSLEGLRARVSSWSLHSGLGWGRDEIDDVTVYLNRRFYQLAR